MTSTPGRRSTTNTIGTSTPSSRTRMSCAGLTSTSSTWPSACPCTSRTSSPTSSWTQMRPSPGSSSGSPTRVAPRSSSAASRSVTPSKRTSHRPWCGRALARTSVRSPTWNTAPGAVRSGRSVCSVRTTSPRTPWGRPTRPSSSSAAPKGRLLDDVDVGLDALAGTSGAHDLPERLDDAAALADQTAHIGGAGVDQELHVVAALGHVDLDGLGLFGDVAGHVLDDGTGASAEDPIPLWCDLVVVLVVFVVEVVVDHVGALVELVTHGSTLRWCRRRRRP